MYRKKIRLNFFIFTSKQKITFKKKKKKKKKDH